MSWPFLSAGDEEISQVVSLAGILTSVDLDEWRGWWREYFLRLLLQTFQGSDEILLSLKSFQSKVSFAWLCLWHDCLGSFSRKSLVYDESVSGVARIFSCGLCWTDDEREREKVKIDLETCQKKRRSVKISHQPLVKCFCLKVRPQGRLKETLIAWQDSCLEQRERPDDVVMMMMRD